MFVVCLTVLLFLGFQVGALDDNLIQDGGIVSLSLANKTANEIDYEIVKLYNNASISITVNEIPNGINFVILQVHAFSHPVTLKYSTTTTNNNNINGTNIGLVKFTNSSSKMIFYLNNIHNFKVSTLIAVIGYSDKSPVPGGCAMESPTKIAPYLDISYTDTMITVKGGPSSASAETPNCNLKTGLKYTFYQSFIPERDFSEETYFKSILSMMTYNDVSRSIEALQSPQGPPLQRIFSSYPGIGRVFTAIVSSPNGASVYVPTFTYSCNTTYNTDSCVILMSPFTTIEFGIIAFLGIFICLYGHKYFLLNLFFMGSITGTFISYVLLLKISTVEMDYVMVANMIGVVFGVIWAFIWWSLRIPILSVFIPLLNCCFLITAILFSFIRDMIPLLESDANYWVVFFSISLVLVFFTITRSLASNIAASSIVGAHLMIIPIAISVGSGLAFVVINVVRRATVEGFNQANTEIPSQVPDVVLWVCIWLLVFVGCCKQSRQAMGRPPFPPLPFLFRQDERTALVADAHYPTYTM